jgi:hypothetical protein
MKVRRGLQTTFPDTRRAGVGGRPGRARVAPQSAAASRRFALAAVAIGLALVLIGERLAPIASPPLYDGVVVTDPYRWLSPPPGALAGALGATGTASVQGESPVVAIATPEEPPQAQIFATPGALILPPDTLSLQLSIQPVLPNTAPEGGVLDGNEYEISVLNQSGSVVTGRPDGQVTVILRGLPTVTNATIERFDQGSWQALPTESAGLPATFLAIVTGFGAFALVAPAPAQSSPSIAATATSSPAVSESVDPAGEDAAMSSGSSQSGARYLPVVLGALCAVVIGVGFVFETRRYRRDR